MEYKIQTTGLKELVVRAQAAGANVQPLLQAGLTKAALHIQQLARQKAPHRTGNLQRSILTELGPGFSRVNVNEKYGLYVERGTPAHDIYPKTKKALYWRGAAFPVRHVKHPGTRPQPFFQPAIEESLPYIEGVFASVGNVISSQIAGK